MRVTSNLDITSMNPKATKRTITTVNALLRVNTDLRRNFLRG